MSQLGVIILIDVVEVLKNNTFEGNTYMIDNNKYNGSINEGTDKLETSITGTQIVNWLASPISGTSAISIESITGEAVDKGVMVPIQNGSPAFGASEGLWWGGTVDSNVDGRYSYDINILFQTRTETGIEEKKMALTSYVNVKKAFSDVA